MKKCSNNVLEMRGESDFHFVVSKDENYQSFSDEVKEGITRGTDEAEPETLERRLWRIHPAARQKQKNEILFHVPHKKLLERIERKRDIPEPLTGFGARQEDIRQRVTKVKKIPSKDEMSQTKISPALKTGPVKIHVKPKEKLFQDEDDFQREQKLRALEIANQLDLIDELRSDKKIAFYYMIYAVDRTSEFFTPYALKVVQFKELKETYMTLSLSGVTQYSEEEITFTPLELWEREYKYYRRLVKIKTFVTYRAWKAFYVWRKSITFGKFLDARNHMEKNLFISDRILSIALLEIKSMCAIFLDSSFIDSSVIEKLPIFVFIEMQFGKLETLREKLDEFRKISMDIVNNACLAALLDAGYTPDDSNITIEQTAYGKLGQFGATKFRMPKDGILKMSYIEQAHKREKCYRLCCFIHLVDYMQTSMMHGLLRNTYRELLKNLESHTSFLPEDSSFEDDRLDVVLEAKRSSNASIQSPYFMMDLLMSRKSGIMMEPSEEIFRYVLTTLQSMWEENLDGIQPLLSDSYFNSFTRYCLTYNNLHC